MKATIHFKKHMRPRVMTLVIIAQLSICSLSSCKKFVSTPAPVSTLNSENVYNNDATAISVLTGVYTNINSSFVTNLSALPALSADEFTLYPGANKPDLSAYYTNKLTSQNATDFWSTIYPYIFTVNSAIEGLNGSSGLTPAVKQQLLGEAYFMRAYFYFYLVNFYGDVPLVTSTDYKNNDLISRAVKTTVWQQIISDLTQAQGLLSTNYLDGTLVNTSSERIRPTKWAATALLARVYLYTGKWQDAITQSTTLISNTSLFSLSKLDNAFLKASLGNNEAIWQMQPVTNGQTTPDGAIFVLPATGPSENYPFYLSQSLINSFEPGDQRMTSWVNSVTVNSTTYYFPYKYKKGVDPTVTSTAAMTEYEMIFRLGEQYLIRSEAEAELGQAGPAATDLNVIRTRAGLPNTSAGTQSDLLTAILHERQVELFTEQGQRWLDLKRTGTVNAVMTAADPLKGSSWNSYQQLYPIPSSQILSDPKLVQNSGY